jgi:protein-S-isoprenylcysteine O-methyltransferase Ste14
LRLIVRGLWIAVLAAILLSFVEATQVSPAAGTGMVFGGTILLLGGSLLRRLCWRTLGAYFTGDVQARSDQPVIDRGPYRWVRHPSYTGGILMFTGVGVALSNWLSIAVLVMTSIGVYSYRVHVEERALLEALGAAYAAYMKRTTRYIPFII